MMMVTLDVLGALSQAQMMAVRLTGETASEDFVPKALKLLTETASDLSAVAGCPIAIWAREEPLSGPWTVSYEAGRVGRRVRNGLYLSRPGKDGTFMVYPLNFWTTWVHEPD